MSDSFEYDFRNYHFKVTEHPRGDGVIIQITGKDKCIQSDELDEVNELINNMGKWEKMIISIMNLNKVLGIFSGIAERDIEEFIIDNYRIITVFEDPSITRGGAIQVRISPYNPKTAISTNIIFNLLKSATKWKLLNETLCELKDN